uniref:Uncharacterized protein n=1 Tax=Tetraselmis sp. GSL018 TaxID=582737 RepID=A0A061S5J7_9CHLO
MPMFALCFLGTNTCSLGRNRRQYQDHSKPSAPPVHIQCRLCALLCAQLEREPAVISTISPETSSDHMGCSSPSRSLISRRILAAVSSTLRYVWSTTNQSGLAS